METDLADLSCCSLSCRSIDGDLTRTSNDLRSTPYLRETCTNLLIQEILDPGLGVWVAEREEGSNLVGGCKEEGASASLLSFLIWTWRQETLGFLALGAWRMAGERGRRERETWEKGFSYFLA